MDMVLLSQRTNLGKADLHVTHSVLHLRLPSIIGCQQLLHCYVGPRNMSTDCPYVSPQAQMT